MKKIALISALALSGLIYNTADAQIHLGLRLGIHLPGASIAVQAPVYQEANYTDNGEDYYYLPDVDAYYSVPENCYYYNDGYNWVSAAYLPGEYRNYDWRNARRYEVRAHRPFMNNDFYRARFRGNVGNWGRYNDRPDRNYANRDFRDDHRDSGPRFVRSGEHADDRGWGNGNRDDRGWNRGRDDHFDNRNQGGNYNQPNRDNQGQGNYNQRNNDNRNQNGNNNQPSQPDRSQGQPSRQNGGNNGGGNQRDNGGNQSHFTDNRGQQRGHDRMRS